jgi:hypothetical protein
MRGIYRIAEDLSGFQDGFCSMESIMKSGQHAEKSTNMWNKVYWASHMNGKKYTPLQKQLSSINF